MDYEDFVIFVWSPALSGIVDKSGRRHTEIQNLKK